MTERSTSPDKEKNYQDRELAVVREARFFEPYKKELKELFAALGREDMWSDNPRDILPYVRAGWIGQEHGNSVDKDQFTDEQTVAALALLQDLGFASEQLPNEGDAFEQTVIVAGTTTANYRREGLVLQARENGVDIGTEVWLVGQRPREARDGTNEALLGSEGIYAGNDLTEIPEAAHARRIIEESSGEGADPWKFTETETARLVFQKLIDPSLKPHRYDLNLVEVNGKSVSSYRPVDDAPSRDITDYHYKTEDGHDIVLLNAAAVERYKNTDERIPSRHTTTSATQEWLERQAPSHGARVLYVTGNPHSLRTTQDTYKMLVDMGREDIELVVAGTTPAANTPIQTYLGEIARLIDNDVKRNYQDA